MATTAASNTHRELLQDCLVFTGHVETCCLIKRKTLSVKATSYGFEPSSDLVPSLTDAFAKPSIAREKGVHFNGANYSCVRADDHSIYGKKVGGSGFVAVKTDNFIIYGSYSSSMFPSVCVEAVESLGDYYKDRGK